MHRVLYMLFGGWLGVALAGTIYDWYWWVNVVGLNILLAAAAEAKE